MVVSGVAGMQFAVWAPNAQRVSVIADFNAWDGRVHPMRCRVEAGRAASRATQPPSEHNGSSTDCADRSNERTDEATDTSATRGVPSGPTPFEASTMRVAS